MSLIKSIKQQLGLGTAAENHFWDGSVANQLTLKRGTPDAPGAELLKAIGDALSFPSQGQSLTANGYIKLPGGLIVQWGSFLISTVTANTPVAGVQDFPIPFPNAVLQAITSPTMPDVNVTSQITQALTAEPTLTQMSVRAVSNISATNIQCAWIAIGY